MNVINLGIKKLFKNQAQIKIRESLFIKIMAGIDE